MRNRLKPVGIASGIAIALSTLATPAAFSAEQPEGYYENFDQSKLKAVHASSEELTGEAAPSGPVTAALDGSAGTF